MIDSEALSSTSRKNKTPAELAFGALPDAAKLGLLNQVFTILEYDSDGNPGRRWSPDTLQDLDLAFARDGVKFSSLRED